jgi:hypothetical protein
MFVTEYPERAMDDETHDDNEKQRKLDFLREKLTPIYVERAREIDSATCTRRCARASRKMRACSTYFLVRHGWTLDAAFAEVPVAATDLVALRSIANTELDHLEEHNCAVYDLARDVTRRWVDAGRPR